MDIHRGQSPSEKRDQDSDQMLKDLTIHNYRLFKQFELTTVARVNLIVGTNNSGKSSLLEALYLLTNEDVSSGLLYVLNERGEFSLRTTDPRLERQRTEGYHVSQLFYGRTLKPETAVWIHSGPEKNGTWVRISRQEGKVPRESPQLALFPDVEVIEAYDQAVFLLYEHSRRRGTPTSLRLTADGLLPYAYSRAYAKRAISVQGTSKLVTTNHLGYDELAMLWDNITLTPKESRVIEALQILEPRVERISFTSVQSSNSGILLKLKGETDPVPLGSMGDGMRRVLAITASLVSVDNGTLLVDEIDTGLYYGVLTDVWRLVLETASKQNAQVFATTHSWDCVKAFQEALRESKDPGLGCLIRLEKVDQQIRTVTYSADELDIAIQQGIEVR